MTLDASWKAMKALLASQLKAIVHKSLIDKDDLDLSKSSVMEHEF